eukprot:806366-Prymnesium_polylepis.1
MAPSALGSSRLACLLGSQASRLDPLEHLGRLVRSTARSARPLCSLAPSTATPVRHRRPVDGGRQRGGGGRGRPPQPLQRCAGECLPVAPPLGPVHFGSHAALISRRLCSHSESDDDDDDADDDEAEQGRREARSLRFIAAARRTRERFNAERADPMAPVVAVYLKELFSSPRHAVLPGALRGEQLQSAVVHYIAHLHDWADGTDVPLPPFVRLGRPTALPRLKPGSGKPTATETAPQ